jgi:LuxR family maltose regulon positive regulatory protein
MPDKILSFPIIRSKLFRPAVVSDFVPRPRLFDKLVKGAKCRLTLVSAPAGYGKSQLVSSWLESLDRPACWLSLDEDIGSLNTFLQYLICAIREVSPEACPNTLPLLRTHDNLKPQVILSEFVNELSEIKTPFVLVLDDYGFIHDREIHEFFNQLLNYSFPYMQLVVLTRRDPPFALHSFRASYEMVEIRQLDLQFTVEEMAVFLGNTLGNPLDAQTCTSLHERIEGWAVGMRLIALSLQDQENVINFLREMRGDSRHVNDYLMAEVLSRQEPAIRDGLLQTSILNRFCAPLYSALSNSACKDSCETGCDGQYFINKLEESNLFCIAVDASHEWFRYHRLFQQLLQRTLENRYSKQEIDALHGRARSWFEEQGMLEEAIHHAMATDDLEAAGIMIARHRHELMNREQWHRLNGLLDMLPREIKDSNPLLLIQDAWLLWNRMRIGEMAKSLDRVESLLSRMSETSTERSEIQDELDVLRSIQYYLLPPCDGARALAHAQQALTGISKDNLSTRGMAVIMMALSSQLTGNLDDSFRVIMDELQSLKALRNTCHTRLLITLCMIYWIEGDLANLKQTADQLLELGKELQLPESIAIGQYFLGLFCFCRNELAEAEKYLSSVVANSPGVNIYNYAHGSFLLSLVKQAQGCSTDAVKTVEAVTRFALNTGNSPLLQLATAFKAELALRQGRLAESVQWAKNYEPEPFTTAHRFYVPQLTLARILLARNTPGSREQAVGLLSRLHDFYGSIHNNYCLMNVLALQALLSFRLGDEPAAEKKLARALTLAEPGGFIRMFKDLGTEMAGLLMKQAKKDPASDYSRRLQQAFQKDGRDTDVKPTAVPEADPVVKVSARLKNILTSREQEILELFIQRLSNQEIADSLYIAPSTVKRHTANIYRKLDVNNRREAVSKVYQNPR